MYTSASPASTADWPLLIDSESEGKLTTVVSIWATAEYLHDRVGCRTLLATHYHELIELASMYPHMANYNVSATEFRDKIIFLRKVTRGGSNRSYGIQVARLAGVPAAVIARAKEILQRVESENEGRTSMRGSGGGKGRPAVADAGQLSLFAASPDLAKFAEVRALLDEADLESMTPMEAMNLLAALKSKL